MDKETARAEKAEKENALLREIVKFYYMQHPCCAELAITRGIDPETL